MNYSSQESLEDSLIGIRELINSYLKGYRTKGIKEIANESGLNKHLPILLKQWGDNDYCYSADIYTFLMNVVEHEKPEFYQILFQNIFDSIKKFRRCKIFKKGCSLPKENGWDDNICKDCTSYMDNNLKLLFNRYLEPLGLLIDDSEVIQIIGDSSLNLKRDIEQLKSKTPPGSVESILPPEIIEKGTRMAEAYSYLYSIENSLRQFLESVFQKEFGNPYEDHIKIPKGIKTKIDGRKINESKNKWLPLRGESIFYYMDFGELGRIIMSNWELFERYFPDQDFIIPKINELSECRHLIAHNSYIDDESRQMIQIYYALILKQICSNLG